VSKLDSVINEIIEYLNHRFELIIISNYGKTYTCNRCNCKVDKFIDTPYYKSNKNQYWLHDIYGKPYKILNLTCDEMIIKNIVE